jgi:hypothetical protein
MGREERPQAGGLLRGWGVILPVRLSLAIWTVHFGAERNFSRHKNPQCACSSVRCWFYFSFRPNSPGAVQTKCGLILLKFSTILSSAPIDPFSSTGSIGHPETQPSRPQFKPRGVSKLATGLI